MKTSTKIIIVILVIAAIAAAFAGGFYFGQKKAAQDYETKQTATYVAPSSGDSSSQSQGDTNTQKPVIPEGGGYAGSSNHGI